jgi:HSP20 family protein
MALLEVWSPFRELERFRKEFDDVFERVLGGAEHRRLGLWPVVPTVESFVQEGNLIMRFDLPGVDPGKVEVKVAGNLLTVSGSREEKYEKKGRTFMHREVTYGSFERTVELPAGVKSEDLKANYKDGVLELTAPLPKETVPRAIKVETGNSKNKKITAKE